VSGEARERGRGKGEEGEEDASLEPPFFEFPTNHIDSFYYLSF